jgi:hypothetical protein
MIRWLGRLVLYRFVGARALAVLAVINFARRRLGGGPREDRYEGSSSPKSDRGSRELRRDR